MVGIFGRDYFAYEEIQRFPAHPGIHPGRGEGVHIIPRASLFGDYPGWHLLTHTAHERFSVRSPLPVPRVQENSFVNTTHICDAFESMDAWYMSHDCEKNTLRRKSMNV